MTRPLPDRIEAGEATDARIDELMAKGWDWHSAYRKVLTERHAADFAVTALVRAVQEGE